MIVIQRKFEYQKQGYLYTGVPRYVHVFDWAMYDERTMKSRIDYDTAHQYGLCKVYFMDYDTDEFPGLME